MRRWAEEEWFHCLFCFYNTKNLDEAIVNFSQHYPDRSLIAIRNKFEREQISIDDYLGSGVGRSRLSKRIIVRDLQDIYKTYGQPFDINQYQKLSSLGYEIVIGQFGSWNRALKEADLIQKFDAFNNLQNEIKAFNPEKEIQKNWKKKKEDLIRKSEDKVSKKFKTKMHTFDVLTEMVTDAVKILEEPRVNVKQKIILHTNDPTQHCTLWFEFSDLQLGTLIEGRYMSNLNTYDWDVWLDELTIWKKEVIRLIEENERKYIIDKIVFSLLGDFVEGVDIFHGQTWSVDKHVVDQAIVGAEDVSKAFIEIFKSFEHHTFHLFEVFGNHGRLGRKGETPYSNSMDKVFLRFLKLRIESAVSNFIYYENECWFYLVDIYGWNHLLLHGDQGMSSLWSKRPTINGLEKGIARYNQMLQQQIHFIHAGHFHQDWQLSFNMSQMLINGSFVGTSQFSASQMVSGSAPVQTMHVFDPKYGLISTTRIHLYEDDVRLRVKPNKTLV